EEERRLFYVSITRAKNELYLCNLKQRTKFSDGTFSIEDLYPSRFLSEIPGDLLNQWNLRSHY
ncbi:MAG TPA: 3'-5' exonuclease, partial [Candidatus Saccharimonadales bacterium]|nr:3'-5' exonuclease [Candidatus Saccharimonadales bacterium]